MLTPKFSAEQDDDYIRVHIIAPYIKFTEAEMVVVGDEFTFYCKPYYLKLYFSGKILEDGTETAIYSVDKKAFEIKLSKAVKGEVFKNLDMLTALMTPSNPEKVRKKPVIEVIDQGIATNQQRADDADDDDIDWSIEQTAPEEGILTLSSPKYGFNDHATQVFCKRPEDQHELLDISDPDGIPSAERVSLQLAYEQSNFNSDHYIGDLMDDDTVNEFVCCNLSSSLHSQDFQDNFTEQEMEHLLKLPKKEYIMNDLERRLAFYGLVDILYAYLYELRTNCGDMSVESAWTIRKLSSTMSWLTTSTDLRNVVISCIRRSLCFPLYRHWILSMKILEDLQQTLMMGKKVVLKCFLHIYDLFSNTEPYYIMNDLYISDYCVWIQTINSNHLQSLANIISKFQIGKEDVNLNITAIESRLLKLSELSLDSDDDSDVSSESSDGSCYELNTPHTQQVVADVSSSLQDLILK